ANTKYAVLVITVVAAIVTPTPDALTMLMVMAVMTGVYFIGVGVSWAVVRKRERRLAAEKQGESMGGKGGGVGGTGGWDFLWRVGFCVGETAGEGRAGVWIFLCALTFAGCKTTAKGEAADKANAPFMTRTTSVSPQVPDDALPPEKTGGFDGAKAYGHVARLVNFGPRPAGSQAIL